jgi:hypothetical protein
MGICGTNAGELIAEPTLAIEMGCDMSDIALTIHAHPTLSETTLEPFLSNFSRGRSTLGRSLIFAISKFSVFKWQ